MIKGLRYIAVLLMVLATSEVWAWTAEVNKAILMLAEENLSQKTKREVVEVLGTSLSAVEFVNNGKSTTHLTESGKSVTTNEDDAVVKLEKAIAILEKAEASAEERKSALLTAVEMTVDIHCLSNILIDKHLEKDFKYGRDNGRPKNSRWFKVQEREWQAMWHSQYHESHGAFSAEMYLYDWHIATKGMAKLYKKQPVAPRAWVEQTGAIVLDMLKIFYPDAVVNMIEITKLEYVNNSAMYDAAFRLANLLNTVLK